MSESTIIITHKDKQQYLSLCIFRLKQYYSGKIIVVDGGSSCLPMLPDDVRLIFSPQKNKIFHKTKLYNIGINETTTPVVGFLDCDILVPQKINEIANAVNDETIKSCLHLKNMSKEYWDNYKWRRLSIEDAFDLSIRNGKDVFFSYDDHYKQRGTIPVGNSCFFAKTDIIKSINGFDEKYIGHGYEDQDINRRILDFCEKSGQEYKAYHNTDKDFIGIHLFHETNTIWNNCNLEHFSHKIFNDKS